MRGIRSNWMVGIIWGMFLCLFLSPATAQAVIFSDLSDHWGRTYIEQMAAQNWVAGYPDGRFLPDQPISRAEFAVLISRAFQECSENANTPFTSYYDVKPENWFYMDIVGLTRAGIVQGEGYGLFYPQRMIQRQEAAQMLWSCMVRQGIDSRSAVNTAYHFADEQNISNWAHPAVKALTGLKVFLGYPDQCFYPTAPMTRAEACLALYKTITILNNQPTTSSPVMQPKIVIPRASGGSGSSGHISVPYIPPNTPAGLTSNYLNCRIRVVE
jgi:hypothetical protein